MGQERNAHPVSELARAVRTGGFLNFDGPATLLMTSDFLVGLYDSFESPGGAFYQVGRSWGQAFGARLNGWASHYQATVADISLEDLLLLIQDEMTRSGWGRVSFDLERCADSGVILVTIVAGPVSILDAPVGEAVTLLLSGFLAAVFGIVSELPMEAVGCRLMEEIPFAEVVVGHHSRIERVREALDKGAQWTSVLAEL